MAMEIISDINLVYYRLNDATACNLLSADVEGFDIESAYCAQDVFLDGWFSEVVVFPGSKLGLEIWMVFYWGISYSILNLAFFATFGDSI